MRIQKTTKHNRQHHRPRTLHKRRIQQKKPLNTYAIFLDIAKAFDTTWIQGLLFKLSPKGVSGNILCWLNNLLRNHTYNVRIGNTHSDDCQLKVGVHKAHL